ncbi:DUF1876 domain-containing protein [Kutzneria sp. CA-103260]|uniref:DUF1876 domain-containing protein n=1 Tax=Kutzneria sp. CA-103260 TaxID=2802641 RepID=UPI001BAE2B12|nr:DUF1876 domain-containing protein [Kutzneria sp. CA-103260]QUQ64094.1 hypothetical protein JJ691_18140 [Kutzneria sp. CA-103260]
MLQARKWHVEIYIDEHEDHTRTQARLTTQDGAVTVGRGQAHRNPRDANVPEIGDELATARALADLSHQLLDAAAQDVAAVTHRPAHFAE